MACASAVPLRPPVAGVALGAILGAISGTTLGTVGSLFSCLLGSWAQNHKRYGPEDP